MNYWKESRNHMMIERGAVLVTCNNPDVILKLLREKEKRAHENG